MLRLDTRPPGLAHIFAESRLLPLGGKHCPAFDLRWQTECSRTCILGALGLDPTKACTLLITFGEPVQPPRE